MLDGSISISITLYICPGTIIYDGSHGSTSSPIVGWVDRTACTDGGWSTVFTGREKPLLLGGHDDECVVYRGIKTRWSLVAVTAAVTAAAIVHDTSCGGGVAVGGVGGDYGVGAGHVSYRNLKIVHGR